MPAESQLAIGTQSHPTQTTDELSLPALLTPTGSSPGATQPTAPRADRRLKSAPFARNENPPLENVQAAVRRILACLYPAP